MIFDLFSERLCAAHQFTGGLYYIVEAAFRPVFDISVAVNMDFLAIELEIEAGVMVLAYLDAYVVQRSRVFDFSDGLTVR